jgi:serine protease Do
MNKITKLTTDPLKKLILYFIIVSSVIIPGKAFCQKVNNSKLQQTIGEALKKAYPACVQLFAYDTLAKQQAGGQFSGVVISKDGYIFTAAHVAAPGVIYKVTFPDGKLCLAAGLGKIVLADDKTIPDVAMIKIISPGSWPYAQLGSSSSLRVYEPCISISYPESLNQPKPVLRFGYISKIKNDRGFIQSTCLMEPGDSGGPLFDYLGRVIGLHSAIEIPEQSNYDVPVDLYKKYFTALKLPKVYDAYPNKEDMVPADSLASAIISLPGLSNGKSFIGEVSKFSSNCLRVISNVGERPESVNGTLFSFGKNVTAQDFHKCLVVSKSSLVGDKPEIICADRHKVSAKIISRDKENDLVLLEPAEDIKGGISYEQLTTDKGAVVRAGVFLISPQQDTTGIISISGSSVFSVRKMANLGFLGIGFKTRNSPLKVSYVFPNLNKSIYQIKIGDEILAINGNTPENFDDYFKTLEHFWPGDTIKLQLRRSDTTLTKTIILDTLPQRHFNHPAEMFAGGKSIRRDGFNAVFTHDAIVKPNRCGGPVFDLSGNFYGINIARFSRASCLAVPAIVVYDFIYRSISLPGQTKTDNPLHKNLNQVNSSRSFSKIKQCIKS